MNSIPDSSRVMMSDMIADHLEDLDPVEKARSNYIIATLGFQHGSESFDLVGSAVSYLFDEYFELEIKVDVTDAFYITKMWPKISVNSFELSKGSEKISFHEGYKISAFRIQEIDHPMQMCVIAMKLCKELHTYRME